MYEKQNWADGEAGGTPLSAARLNHLEEGVKAAADAAASAAPSTHSHHIQDVIDLEETLEGLSSGGVELPVAVNTELARLDQSGVTSAVEVSPVRVNVTTRQGSGSSLLMESSTLRDDGFEVVRVEGTSPTHSLRVYDDRLTTMHPEGNASVEFPKSSGTLATEEHVASAIENLPAPATVTWETLSGKPSTFAPSEHSHTVAQVTGLQAALTAIENRLDALETPEE